MAKDLCNLIIIMEKLLNICGNKERKCIKNIHNKNKNIEYIIGIYLRIIIINLKVKKMIFMNI